jgi:hypothetical protein
MCATHVGALEQRSPEQAAAIRVKSVFETMLTLRINL